MYGAGVSAGGGGGGGGGGGLSPRATGWAAYLDSQYTSASPLILTGGQRILIPNNAASKNESQLPEDLGTFYNPANGKITGSSGSDLIITLRCKMVPKELDTVTALVELDTGIDGSPNVIDAVNVPITWGVDIEQRLSVNFSAYCLNIFQTNGGRLFITPNELLHLYDITLLVKRTHKGV